LYVKVSFSRSNFASWKDLANYLNISRANATRSLLRTPEQRSKIFMVTFNSATIILQKLGSYSFAQPTERACRKFTFSKTHY